MAKGRNNNIIGNKVEGELERKMTKNTIRTAGIMIVCLCAMACAPVHQLVKARILRDEQGSKKVFYGISYNHTLIPEYTKSASGTYAATREEALGLYNARGAELDTWIGNKYRLTNSTWYRWTSPISRLGLAAASPLVIPFEWAGERFFPDRSLGDRRTFRQITQDYFEPTFDEPVLKQVGPEGGSAAADASF